MGTKMQQKNGFTPTPIFIGVGPQGGRGFIPYESSSFKTKDPTGYLVRNTRNFRTGFTLIELLVVISIISLIASVVLAALNTAKAKARDAQILSDIRTLATVMELYYDDHGYYPPASNSVNCCGNFAPVQLKGNNTDSFFKSQLEPYLKQLPNPTTYTDQSFKGAGWGWGGSGFSRISYNRPWGYKNEIYTGAGVICDPSSWGVSKNCYILTIRTETKTSLGPAETRIYIITGKNGRGKIVDVNNTYTWGIF